LNQAQISVAKWGRVESAFFCSARRWQDMFRLGEWGLWGGNKDVLGMIVVEKKDEKQFRPIQCDNGEGSSRFLART
jgi:hypothetical protein